MANSKITLTFTDEPINGNQLSIYWREIGNPLNIGAYVATWRVDDPRTAIGNIPVRTQVGVAGEESSNEYGIWVNFDNPGIFTVDVITDAVVVLTFNSDEWEFTSYSDTSGFISGVIDNYVPPTFDLVSVVEVADADPCNLVKLDITATEPIKSLRVDGTIYTVDTPNVFKTISVSRGTEHVVSMIDINDYEVDFITKKWDYLNVANINIYVTPSIAGATVIVDVTKKEGLTLQYSLNGTDWQTSNTFTGQPDGLAKTMYVKDQFGCQVNLNYDVTEFGTRDPYFFISQASGINFVKIETVDDCSIYPNHDNTFAFESLAYMKYCAEQLMQTCDPTTIQIKTNYDTPSAKLRREDTTELALTLTKKTSNLNRYERLDAIWFQYNSTQTGIYFDSGNTYDSGGLVTGTFTLNGNLPEFGVIGNFVNLVGVGTFEIIDSLYHKGRNKKILIINKVHTGGDVSGQVYSEYDLLPYEVYEFSVDWSVETPGVFDILIQNDDAVNPTIQHLSENIYLEVKHEETLAIKYWNDNNRDVFYKFGIQHFLRLKYFSIVSQPKQEQSVNIGDKNSVVVNSSVNGADVFTFDEITQMEMEKLIIALSCDNVYINGIGYIKDGEAKVNNIENSNLYSVEASMLRTGENYNNLTTGQTGADSGYVAINIPPIIGDNLGNLIKG